MLREEVFRLLYQCLHPLAVSCFHCPLAGGEVCIRRKSVCRREKHQGHIPSHNSGPSRHLDQQIVSPVRYSGIEVLESVKFSVPNGQYCFIIVAHVQGPLAHLIHIGGDAPGHPPQELFRLGHGLLLPLPLLHQRVDDGALFRGAQVDNHVLRLCLFPQTEVPGVGSVVSVERLGDGGGDEEHPVQIRAAFTQRLAGNKTLGDRPVAFIPLQIHIQIGALTAAVVGSTEDIRAFGDLPAVLPFPIHEEIFVRQAAHALQTVLQFLKDLLCGTLAGILRLPGISRQRLPAG